MQQTKKPDWKKYFFVFIITAAIFGTALYFNNYFNDKRIQEIQSIQNAISTDILSSETQFSLLSELSCKDIGSSILSKELNTLADKIEYSEKNIGTDDNDVVQLKKYYSLLEIKDYLLMKRVSEQCGKKFVFVLYFYSNSDKCPDCEKAAYVLTYLREKYPQLRVYSFDYNLDLSAIKTIIALFKIKNDLPAVVLDEKVLNGFQDKDSLEKSLKEVYPKVTATIPVASTTPSSKK